MKAPLLDMKGTRPEVQDIATSLEMYHWQDVVVGTEQLSGAMNDVRKARGNRYGCVRRPGCNVVLAATVFPLS